MRRPRGIADHKIAPSNRRHTPHLSGDYDVDAAIAGCANRSVPDKLALYLDTSVSYRPVTAYNGYAHTHGDD